MPDWFFVEAGRAVGPLSRIELEASVRAGRVTPDTLICEDGQAEWRLARKVPGLIPPKVMKAWQASVLAAARAEAPPPAPVPLPPAASARRVAGPPEAAPRRGCAAPVASPLEPVAAAGGASSLRRHAVLVALVAAAALAGGGLGAVLVLRLAGPRLDATTSAAVLAPAGAPSSPAPATPPPPASSLPASPSPPPSPPASTAAAAAAGQAVAEPPARLRPVLPDAPPPLPAAAQAIVDARLALLRDGVAAYVAASEDFVASGGLDASTLGSREAIAARLLALEDLRARNESLRRSLSSLPDLVRADALEAGLEPEVADAASRRARADVAAQAREREEDAELHVLAGEALALLESSFGTWGVTEPGRAVEFAPAAGPEVPQRYARLVEDAAELARRP